MGRRKIEIRVHPLLDQLRPRLKRSARKALEKSLIRVGQLSEVLVTADGYILDGRDRYELVKSLGMEPRTQWLTMHSGIGEMPPGYDREDELQMCREVIEETGRGKWRDSHARRAGDSGIPITAESQSQRNPNPIAEPQSDSGTPATAEPQSDSGTPILDRLAAVPCDAGSINVKIPRHLREHLETMALKHGTVRKSGKARKITVASVPEYIRRLCWQDFINHSSVEEPCSPHC